MTASRRLQSVFDLHFRSDTKPDRRVMRLLLAAMCAGLGLFFVVTIWRQAAAVA